MNLYRRVLRYYRPYLSSIVFSLLLLLVTCCLNLFQYWPVQWIIDQVLTPHGSPLARFGGLTFSPAHAILAAAAALVALTLLTGLFSFWNNYLLIRIGLKALLQLRTEVYARLQSLPLPFHDARRSGDSTFRVAYDTQAVQTFFNRGFATVFGSVVTLLTTFGFMLAMDAELAVLTFLIAPFLFAVIYAFADRVRRQTAVYQQAESNVLARAGEGLTSIRLVQAFNREETEVRDFAHEVQASFAAQLQLTRTNAVSSLVVSSLMALGTAVVLYVAAFHILAGRLSLGYLWLFLNYVRTIYQPLEQLSYTAWSMEGAVAGMERVFAILDSPDAVPELPGAQTLPTLRGEITFEQVHFQYEPDRPILRDISLKIAPGQSVALVGGTGAGKTTLLSLVPRFYDPLSGRVLLDGHDIRHATKSSLRRQISLVHQDTILLSGSIRDNIAYGRPGASPSEIEAAAAAAQADEFIRELPLGYATLVGERGVRLSGGQKQRIALARAFLKNAPVLLLDEPTSALDLATEAEIITSLHRLMRRSTTLIVTHRLATIHHVDYIYVLDQGRVVEEGTGPELLAQNGVYAQLWHAHETALGSPPATV